MDVTIRDVRASDLDAVLELNEAVVPDVNSLSIADLQWFADSAHYFRIAHAGDRFASFLIGMRPGTDYASPNYRWFVENYDDFGYIDRIAVAEHARRLGLASRLYDDFRAALPETVAVMTCEVNLHPPNDSSMRFHERKGFRTVGTQQTEGGKKEVALMELRL